MGNYLNSKSSYDNFIELTREKYFVDKSKVIIDLNKMICTKGKYVCVTRPRRFGKTCLADMLVAYYSKDFESHQLFDKLKVAKGLSDDKEIKNYNENINKYNIIHMNFSEDVREYDSLKEYLKDLEKYITSELREYYHELEDCFEEKLIRNLKIIYNKMDEKFIFIIDEWDYIFNNNLFTKKEREEYLVFLKDLLKDKGYVALAYMTGVLPIAKYSSGSALNMFDEHTMFNDVSFIEYLGFTDEEVKNLCKKNNVISYEELANWYNGYVLIKIDNDGKESKVRIFNPRSVVKALKNNKAMSYWTETGPMNEIVSLIDNNVEDVREDMVKMVSGESIEIILEPYSAESMEITTREEIYAAMVTYGFLTYYDGKVSIPNKELMLKFEAALRNENMGYIGQLTKKSDKMLEATLNKDTSTMIKRRDESSNGIVDGYSKP